MNNPASWRLWLTFRLTDNGQIIAVLFVFGECLLPDSERRSTSTWNSPDKDYPLPQLTPLPVPFMFHMNVDNLEGERLELHMYSVYIQCD
jgi:hypothetical protein